MAVVNLTRVFRFNGVDLPDPDPDMSTDKVRDHYAQQYPSLRHGKVEESGIEGDRWVFNIKPTDYKPNG